MKVIKILNNNAVTTVKNGETIILIGTGIGFKKKKGDDIDPNKIQTYYFPTSNKLSLDVITLLEELPVKVGNVIFEVAKIIEDDIGEKINGYSYISLIDHISSAIERRKKGIEIENPLLLDVKRFYNQEFQLAKGLVNILNSELEISLNENEAAFLALHIVNMKYNVGIEQIDSFNDIVHDIVRIIEDEFNQSIDKEDLSYARFLNHLKYFAQRILSQKEYKTVGICFLNNIKINFPKAYYCGLHIKRDMEEKYAYEINDEELTYLCIHIQRLFSK